MHTITRLALAPVLLVTLTRAADAQTIATDRSGLSFATSTVPARRLQVELGLPALTYDGAHGDPAGALTMAFRYGLADRLEARASTTWAVRTPAEPGLHGPTGIAGLRTGAKVTVASGPAFSMVVVPEVVLPVGNQDLAGDRASYSLNAAAGMPLGSASLTLVAGAQADPAGEDDRETTLTFGAVLGRSLTSTVSGYLEAGVFPGHGDNGACAGLGLYWLPSPLVQLDAWSQFGLVDATPDASLGVGVSFLIPRR